MLFAIMVTILGLIIAGPFGAIIGLLIAIVALMANAR